MNKSILIAAATAATILSGMTSFTPTAEAGGIRVGFGFPMGSFVARPSRGGSASSSYGSSGMCKKKSPSYASRSRPEPRHESKVASKRPQKETKVASHEYSAPKKSRSVYRAEKDDASIADTSEEIETSTTGSTALIETDAKNADVTTVEIPADLPAEAPVADTATVAANTPAETPAAATAVVTETPAPVAAEAPAVTETPVTTAVVEEPKAKKSKNAKDCTKYIPAIGVTVSVGC